MPSRILKESILDSPTLARLDDFYQDQFPRLLLLVDDWGCFNADPDTIKGHAYPKRPKVTVKIIEQILRAFYDAGMLFMWFDKDRIFGYWVGWDNHNYCNASAVEETGRQAKHRRKTPEPPIDLLEQYVASHQDKLEQTRTKVFIPIPIPIPIPNKKNKAAEEKCKFGDHGNVLLTDKEHADLVEKFGDVGAKERIAGADLWFGSKGNAAKYESHYLSILNWDRMKKEKTNGHSRASPEAHLSVEERARIGREQQAKTGATYK